MVQARLGLATPPQAGRCRRRRGAGAVPPGGRRRCGAASQALPKVAAHDRLAARHGARTHSTTARVLVEVGGVGYLVTVTPRTLAELEPDVAGVPLRPPPHPRRRPDAVRVPATRRARHVRGPDRHPRHRPGAGAGDPRHALADGARRHRRQQRLGALTLVPGVGKKTAERLLVELRNRLYLPMLDPLPVGAGGRQLGGRRRPRGAGRPRLRHRRDPRGAARAAGRRRCGRRCCATR